MQALPLDEMCFMGWPVLGCQRTLPCMECWGKTQYCICCVQFSAAADCLCRQLWLNSAASHNRRVCLPGNLRCTRHERHARLAFTPACLQGGRPAYMIHYTYGQLCHVPGSTTGGGVWNNGSAPTAAAWRFDKRDYLVSRWPAVPYQKGVRACCACAGAARA